MVGHSSSSYNRMSSASRERRHQQRSSGLSTATHNSTSGIGTSIGSSSSRSSAWSKPPSTSTSYGSSPITSSSSSTHRASQIPRAIGHDSTLMSGSYGLLGRQSSPSVGLYSSKASPGSRYSTSSRTTSSYSSSNQSPSSSTAYSVNTPDRYNPSTTSTSSTPSHPTTSKTRDRRSYSREVDSGRSNSASGHRSDADAYAASIMQKANMAISSLSAKPPSSVSASHASSTIGDGRRPSLELNSAYENAVSRSNMYSSGTGSVNSTSSLSNSLTRSIDANNSSSSRYTSSYTSKPVTQTRSSSSSIKAITSEATHSRPSSQASYHGDYSSYPSSGVKQTASTDAISSYQSYTPSYLVPTQSSINKSATSSARLRSAKLRSLARTNAEKNNYKSFRSNSVCSYEPDVTCYDDFLEDLDYECWRRGISNESSEFDSCVSRSSSISRFDRDDQSSIVSSNLDGERSDRELTPSVCADAEATNRTVARVQTKKVEKQEPPDPASWRRFVQKDIPSEPTATSDAQRLHTDEPKVKHSQNDGGNVHSIEQPFNGSTADPPKYISSYSLQKAKEEEVAHHNGLMNHHDVTASTNNHHQKPVPTREALQADTKTPTTTATTTTTTKKPPNTTVITSNGVHQEQSASKAASAKNNENGSESSWQLKAERIQSPPTQVNETRTANSKDSTIVQQQKKLSAESVQVTSTVAKQKLTSKAAEVNIITPVQPPAKVSQKQSTTAEKSTVTSLKNPATKDDKNTRKSPALAKTPGSKPADNKPAVAKPVGLKPLSTNPVSDEVKSVPLATAKPVVQTESLKAGRTVQRPKLTTSLPTTEFIMPNPKISGLNNVPKQPAASTASKDHQEQQIRQSHSPPQKQNGATLHSEIMVSSIEADSLSLSSDAQSFHDPPAAENPTVDVEATAVVEPTSKKSSSKVECVEATVICSRPPHQLHASASMPMATVVKKRTKPVAASSTSQTVTNINLERAQHRRAAAIVLPEKERVRKKTKPVQACTNETTSVTITCEKTTDSQREAIVWPEKERVRKKTRPVKASTEESIVCPIDLIHTLDQDNVVKVLTDKQRAENQLFCCMAGTEAIETNITVNQPGPVSETDAQWLTGHRERHHFTTIATTEETCSLFDNFQCRNENNVTFETILPHTVKSTADKTMNASEDNNISVDIGRESSSEHQFAKRIMPDIKTEAMTSNNFFASKATETATDLNIGRRNSQVEFIEPQYLVSPRASVNLLTDSPKYEISMTSAQLWHEDVSSTADVSVPVANSVTVFARLLASVDRTSSSPTSQATTTPIVASVSRTHSKRLKKSPTSVEKSSEDENASDLINVTEHTELVIEPIHANSARIPQGKVISLDCSLQQSAVTRRTEATFEMAGSTMPIQMSLMATPGSSRSSSRRLSKQSSMASSRSEDVHMKSASPDKTAVKTSAQKYESVNVMKAPLADTESIGPDTNNEAEKMPSTDKTQSSGGYGLFNTISSFFRSAPIEPPKPVEENKADSTEMLSKASSFLQRKSSKAKDLVRKNSAAKELKPKNPKNAESVKVDKSPTNSRTGSSENILLTRENVVCKPFPVADPQNADDIGDYDNVTHQETSPLLPTSPAAQQDKSKYPERAFVLSGSQHNNEPEEKHNPVAITRQESLKKELSIDQAMYPGSGTIGKAVASRNGTIDGTLHQSSVVSTVAADAIQPPKNARAERAVNNDANMSAASTTLCVNENTLPKLISVNNVSATISVAPPIRPIIQATAKLQPKSIETTTATDDDSLLKEYDSNNVVYYRRSSKVKKRDTVRTAEEVREALAEASSRRNSQETIKSDLALISKKVENKDAVVIDARDPDEEEENETIKRANRALAGFMSKTMILEDTASGSDSTPTTTMSRSKDISLEVARADPEPTIKDAPPDANIQSQSVKQIIENHNILKVEGDDDYSQFSGSYGWATPPSGAEQSTNRTPNQNGHDPPAPPLSNTSSDNQRRGSLVSEENADYSYLTADEEMDESPERTPEGEVDALSELGDTLTEALHGDGQTPFRSSYDRIINWKREPKTKEPDMYYRRKANGGSYVKSSSNTSLPTTISKVQLNGLEGSGRQRVDETPEDDSQLLSLQTDLPTTNDQMYASLPSPRKQPLANTTNSINSLSTDDARLIEEAYASITDNIKFDLSQSRRARQERYYRRRAQAAVSGSDVDLEHLDRAYQDIQQKSDEIRRRPTGQTTEVKQGDVKLHEPVVERVKMERAQRAVISRVTNGRPTKRGELIDGLEKLEVASEELTSMRRPLNMNLTTNQSREQERMTKSSPQPLSTSSHEPSTNQAMAKSAHPTVNSSTAVDTIAAETATKTDFTKQWLQGDINSWLDKQTRTPQGPMSVAEFERQRAMLELSDSDSIGSGSAEVAAINNESIQRSAKFASSRASSQHSVPTKQQPVAKKYKATLQPSPVQYNYNIGDSSPQPQPPNTAPAPPPRAVTKTHVGQVIEQRLRQAGFPNFSPAPSDAATCTPKTEKSTKITDFQASKEESSNLLKVPRAHNNRSAMSADMSASDIWDTASQISDAESWVLQSSFAAGQQAQRSRLGGSHTNVTTTESARLIEAQVRQQMATEASNTRQPREPWKSSPATTKRHNSQPTLPRQNPNDILDGLVAELELSIDTTPSEAAEASKRKFPTNDIARDGVDFVTFNDDVSPVQRTQMPRIRPRTPEKQKLRTSSVEAPPSRYLTYDNFTKSKPQQPTSGLYDTATMHRKASADLLNPSPTPSSTSNSAAPRLSMTARVDPKLPDPNKVVSTRSRPIPTDDSLNSSNSISTHERAPRLTKGFTHDTYDNFSRKRLVRMDNPIGKSPPPFSDGNDDAPISDAKLRNMRELFESTSSRYESLPIKPVNVVQPMTRDLKDDSDEYYDMQPRNAQQASTSCTPPPPLPPPRHPEQYPPITSSAQPYKVNLDLNRIDAVDDAHSRHKSANKVSHFLRKLKPQNSQDGGTGIYESTTGKYHNDDTVSVHSFTAMPGNKSSQPSAHSNGAPSALFGPPQHSNSSSKIKSFFGFKKK